MEQFTSSKKEEKLIDILSQLCRQHTNIDQYRFYNIRQHNINLCMIYLNIIFRHLPNISQCLSMSFLDIHFTMKIAIDYAGCLTLILFRTTLRPKYKQKLVLSFQPESSEKEELNSFITFIFRVRYDYVLGKYLNKEIG